MRDLQTELIINNVEDKVAKILLNGKIEDFDVGEQHE